MNFVEFDKSFEVTLHWNNWLIFKLLSFCNRVYNLANSSFPSGKSREQEKKRINKELANIRSKFKGKFKSHVKSTYIIYRLGGGGGQKSVPIRWP